MSEQQRPCDLEGSGSFGKVFYAVNSQNGQEVAVKLEDQSGNLAENASI